MRRSQLDTLAPLARAFAGAFKTATRDSGETFYRLTDGAPEWMRDAVREAHDGEFPNNWRYDTCARVVDDLADALERGDDMDDVTHDLADSATDVYHADLARWLADNPSRAAYVDDAAEEYGTGGGVFDLIQRGQYECIRAMAETLLSAIRDAAERAEGDA